MLTWLKNANATADIAVQWLRVPPAMPASHIRVRDGTLAILLLSQLSANAPGKAAQHSPHARILAMDFLDPCFRLIQPKPLWPFEK